MRQSSTLYQEVSTLEWEEITESLGHEVESRNLFAFWWQGNVLTHRKYKAHSLHRPEGCCLWFSDPPLGKKWIKINFWLYPEDATRKNSRLMIEKFWVSNPAHSWTSFILLSIFLNFPSTVECNQRRAFLWVMWSYNNGYQAVLPDIKSVWIDLVKCICTWASLNGWLLTGKSRF